MEEKTMGYEPLGIHVRFPSMVAHANIQASKEAGGGQFELDGRGLMAFVLRSTDNPDEMAVTVQDLRIEFQPMRIEVPNLGGIEIPGFTITKCDLDLDQTRGTWYWSTRQVSLQLGIRLDPDYFPVMRQLGFMRPVTVIAVESGTLDWRDGRRLETHAEPFTLPAPLDFLTVSPGQFDGCAISAKMWVGANCDYARKYKTQEIWICPGDEACLTWEVGGGPTDVRLNPGGPVSASGNMTVKPTSTTTYRITGKDGGCEDSDQVTVRVIRAGENTFTLTANWNPYSGHCVWVYNLPDGLVGHSVIGVEMRHVKCDKNGTTFPEWTFVHTDPDNKIISGNIRVDSWTDIADQPITGRWEFSPVDIPDCTPPYNQSGWEPACFEIRLGCR